MITLLVGVLAFGAGYYFHDKLKLHYDNVEQKVKGWF